VALFRDYLDEPVPEEILLDFMEQGKITEAGTSTIRLGVTSSGRISDPPPSSPIFTPDALPAANLPLHPGLKQAPNMLACIPSGTNIMKQNWNQFLLGAKATALKQQMSKFYAHVTSQGMAQMQSPATVH